MNKKQFSIKFLTIFLLVAFAVVPIVAFTIQLNAVIRKDIYKQVLTEKQSISDLAGREIKNYVENAKNAIDALSEQDAVKNFEDIDAQGKSIAVFQKKYPQLQYVYIMDIDGKVVNVAPQEGWADYDFSDRDWFKQVKSTNSPYTSDSFMSDATNEPMIFTVYPLKDAEGNFIGAVGSDIDLERVSEIIEDIKSGDTGRAFAIDKTGTVVAHPEGKYVLEQYTFKNELASKVLKGEEGTGEYTDDSGKVRIAAYVPVKSLNWGVFFSQDKSESITVINRFIKDFLFTITACIIVAVVSGYYISKILSAALNQLVTQMQDMAEGDIRDRKLSFSLIREFNMAIGAFAAMKQNLRSFIHQVEGSSEKVRESSEHLALSSDEVNTSVQELAKVTAEIAEGSQSQADDSSTALGGMEDISKEIETINKEIVYINDEVNVTYEKATEGKKLAKDSADQIDVINKHVAGSSEVLASLKEKSDHIGKILNMITDVADQTNLLSLNAAIEAARAGEQGRGFAVVAEEIRKLSDETGESAQQIAKLISEMQAGINKYISVMHTTAGKVQQGVRIIGDAEKSFEDIAQSVSILPEKIQEITGQIENTVKAAGNGENSMKHITEVSQQLAAGAEEMAASTEEQSASINILSKMAEELDNGVKVFKL